MRAFNAGDQPALQRLWARAGHGFAWYSTDAPGRRISPAAEDRSTLGRYFAERHGHQEALRLTSFQFNGNTAGYGNFQYELIRQANDLAATAYVGKGAAVCDTTPRTLGVWSMARDSASSVLTCGNYIDTDAPPASFQVVLSVVALPTSPNYPALQTIRTGDGNHPRRLFAKTGLIIKARTSFELIVPPKSRRQRHASASDGAERHQPQANESSFRTAHRQEAANGWPTPVATGSTTPHARLSS